MSRLRIGLSTPVVMQLPGVASGWEAAAGPDDLVAIATAADRLGFDHLTCAEHVAVPLDAAAGRGLTYWDPLATLAFLAAHTAAVRLVTAVLVLGYHHPLEIAKRYGTLDLLSGGRLVLGVGVGSLAPEFALLGASFEGRGERADDAIAALRAALSTPRPAYAGPHYAFDKVAVEPCAVQPRVPIWVGGRSLRSLRRAVGLGDGWIPFGLNACQLRDMLARVQLPAGFEVVLSTWTALDPIGDADAVRRRLGRLTDLGATVVSCSVRAESAAHYCEQLGALRRIADDLPEGRT